MTRTSTPCASDRSLLRSRLYDEVGAHLAGGIERLGWDVGRLARYQRERLRALLARAVERSPFHARRLGPIDPGRFELADLTRLPVMTKTEMMAEFDDVVTDPRLRRPVVDAHLAASVSEPSLLFGEYVCLASGGSSGLRGVFVQTLGEYAEFTTSVVRRVMAAAIAAGGPPPGGLRVAMIGAASPVHSSGFAAAVADGPPIRLIPAPVTLPLAEIVERLNAADPPALLGYPTMLRRLAGEQRAGRLRIAPRSITAMGELLNPADAERIAEVFGVGVIDNFVSTEGLVGHSEPGGRVLSFASDLCLAELVDDDNLPVPAGTSSARVLVTNLHNLTQPLIRYELTDRFTPGPAAPDHGHLRASVDGRADPPLRYGDVEVHPLVIRTVLTKAPVIREYQVRQTERGVAADVVVDGVLDTAALAVSVEMGLREAGLSDPRAAVRVVAALDRHPETGKVRRFVPLPATGPGSRYR
jgi:phenylacetate-CoA ligase